MSVVRLSSLSRLLREQVTPGTVLCLSCRRVLERGTKANRFPFVISEANCLTLACVDSDGQESPGLISYPIQQEVAFTGLHVLMALLAAGLVFHLVDGARNASRKMKCSKMKKGQNFIQVRVEKYANSQEDLSGVRSFRKRSIVGFEYKNIENPNGYPSRIVEISCIGTCLGNELNVAPIRRNILYLRREGEALVLDEMTVTVGCTCVYPEVVEQPTG